MNYLSQHPALSFLATAVLSTLMGLLLRPLAQKLELMDHPGARKVHEESTPWVGGVAIFLAIAVTILWIPAAGLISDTFTSAVLICATFLLLAGAIDDSRGLSAVLRFILQVTCCVVVILLTQIQLEDFGSLFSGSVVSLGIFAFPITIFAALGVINAFNLVDGMDGLAGSLFLIAAVGMAAFAWIAGDILVFWLLGVSAAGVLGFIVLNARFPWNEKARLFMGNSGSLALGFILAWSFISLGSGVDRAFMPITAVWLFAVPLLDTATLIWRRWREGKSALHADQNHLHHLFLRAGFSVETAWCLISLFAVVLALIGIVFELTGLPDWVSFYTFMLIAFTYHFYLGHSWASQRFLGKHFIHHDFEIEEVFVAANRINTGNK